MNLAKDWFPSRHQAGRKVMNSPLLIHLTLDLFPPENVA